MRPALPLALLLASLLGCPGPAASSGDAKSSSGDLHTTEGTIESFGEGRRFVKIHHDTIPGYMPSMTMPFEGDPVQLHGLAVGDRVVLTFVDRDDGHRVIVEIRKR